MFIHRIWSLLLMTMLVASGVASAGDQGKGESQCRLPGDGLSGQPLRYRTQSDGTVRDLNTELTWEVKDTGTGIHGVNRTFTWSDSGTEPDGTAFTVFLDTLNNKCDQDEATSCTRNADCRDVRGKCG